MDLAFCRRAFTLTRRLPSLPPEGAVTELKPEAASVNTTPTHVEEAACETVDTYIYYLHGNV